MGSRSHLGRLEHCCELDAKWDSQWPSEYCDFLSNATDVSISADTEVNSIIFTPEATNQYSITIENESTLTISGVGIRNDSGITQNFVSTSDGAIEFTNSATAGNDVVITNNRGYFNVGSTRFLEMSTAGNATLIANNAFIHFSETSTAANAMLTASGGSAYILFLDASTGDMARVEVFDNAALNISLHNAPGVTIGSIEGNGAVFLGTNNPTVGSSNLSTTFAGAIQGTGGSLTKIGSGTLILSGANTYTGDTNINRGVLQVDGSITSNTFVNRRGTLAGTGTINGNIANNRRVSPGSAGSPGHVNRHR